MSGVLPKLTLFGTFQTIITSFLLFFRHLMLKGLFPYFTFSLSSHSFVSSGQNISWLCLRLCNMD